MRRSDRQTGLHAPTLLPTHNTKRTALSPFNNPQQFSDASPTTIIDLTDPADPRHLIAIMIQTRRQCRVGGLIKRDHTELIHIAKTLGLSPTLTRQIISLMEASPADTTLQPRHLEALAAIPLDSTQKKTRIPIRVFVGLSIWAITIAVAMQMV